MTLVTKVLPYGRNNPRKGEYTEATLRGMSFIDFLGAELAARTDIGEVLSIAKEGFVLLVKHRNDKAASQALDSIYGLVVSTQGSSPYEMKISLEEFDTKRRAQQKEFFDWLEESFWSLLLYKPETHTERTNDSFWFALENDLDKTKTAVVARVAQIWAGGNDGLSLRAFEFLCDCSDSLRFMSRSRITTETVREYRKKHFPNEYSGKSEIPAKNIDMVLSQMRAVIPKNENIIRKWGEHAHAQRAPQNIQELLGHALVKSGVNVFKK